MTPALGLMRRGVAALMLSLAPVCVVAAQGTLSTQGLGFPPGQLSTAALSMGGATGETDPFSPLNPATIRIIPWPIILFQAAPEFREMRVGNQKLRSSVSRFPLFHGSLPLGPRWAVAASASTLLDRTWETTRRDTQVVNGETIAGTLRQGSEGSIADVRLAVAFASASWLRIGLAGHAFTGRDVLTDVRTFDDTLRFAADQQQTIISFGGNALSAGVHTLWQRVGALGVTYRRGGSMRAYSADSETVGRASAPDHFGASFVYLGISGTTLGVRAARDTWSRLKGLSGSLNVHEGWDIGVGGDVLGPRFGGSPIGLRAGMRWRTLPFSASGTAVQERTLSGGFALPMARGGVELSVGALRAARRGGSGLSENAWTISTGFAVRP
jgi:hypothetical protein